MSLVVLAAVVLAGCGSSYTRADFIRRADGICLTTTRAVRSLPPPRFTGTTQQRRSLGAYLMRLAPLVQAEARRLAALPKPPDGPGRRRLLARWLAAVRVSGDELAQLGAATGTGRAGAVARISGELASAPVVRLARRYGARACSGPGATYAAR